MQEKWSSWNAPTYRPETLMRSFDILIDTKSTLCFDLPATIDRVYFQFEKFKSDSYFTVHPKYNGGWGDVELNELIASYLLQGKFLITFHTYYCFFLRESNWLGGQRDVNILCNFLKIKSCVGCSMNVYFCVLGWGNLFMNVEMQDNTSGNICLSHLKISHWHPKTPITFLVGFRIGWYFMVNLHFPKVLVWLWLFLLNAHLFYKPIAPLWAVEGIKMNSGHLCCTVLLRQVNPITTSTSEVGREVQHLHSCAFLHFHHCLKKINCHYQEN